MREQEAAKRGGGRNLKNSEEEGEASEKRGKIGRRGKGGRGGRRKGGGKRRGEIGEGRDNKTRVMIIIQKIIEP